MNWHEKHKSTETLGDRIADAVADFMGSWNFIIIQAVLMSVWLIANILQFSLFRYIDFDPYPFILLNLFMSAEAAFSTPLIMMAQNRQTERDRHQAEADYATNVKAKEEIEMLMTRLNEIETQKLDKILEHLDA